MATRRPAYPPMSQEAWEARTRYLQQALARLKDPSAPKPDMALLTVGPHGPFRTIREAVDPETGEPCIALTVKNTARKERLMPPEVFLVADLHLALGGGASINDTGQGMAYFKLFGGDDKIDLLRLIANAGRGEVAKQHSPEGERLDHHSIVPAFISKTTADAVRDEGKELRTPHRGRTGAIQTSVRFLRANLGRASFKTHEDEYRAILEAAYRLLDALHGGHFAPPPVPSTDY